MEDFSVFTLIRMGDDPGALSELEKRYEVYRTEESSITAGGRHAEVFIGRLETYIDSGVMMPLQEFETGAASFSVDHLAELRKPERLGDLCQKHLFRDSFCYYLKESKRFSSVYLSLFMAGLVSYNEENREFNEVCRVFALCMYFNYHALMPFVGSPEFSRLHHEVHYRFSTQEIRNDVTFYLDFLDENETSLAADAFHNRKIQTKILYRKKNLTENKKAELLNILRLYCKDPLVDYDIIADCIRHLERFFSDVDDIQGCIETFMKDFAFHTDGYSYGLQFIMTVFSRTKDLKTFAFSIGSLRLLNYQDENKKLYELLEKLLHCPDLIPYALYALEMHPDFQTICYRAASSSRDDMVQSQLLMGLDLGIRKNYRLLMKRYPETLMKSLFSGVLLQKIDTLEKVSNSKLPIAEAEFIRSLMINASIYSENTGLADHPKIVEIVEAYYKNFVHTKKVNAHYLNVVLLNYCDRNEEKYEETVKKIREIVMNEVVYEDEISYIDEQLLSKNVNVSEIGAMMDYYRYCPQEKIGNLFVKDPEKYIRFLVTLASHSDGDAILNDCLEILDRLIKIPPERLGIRKKGDSLEQDLDAIAESLEMISIGEILQVNHRYFPNLYKFGINYYAAPVRQCFYVSLVELSKKGKFCDTRLFDLMQKNYTLEENSEILEMMRTILGVQKTEVN